MKAWQQHIYNQNQDYLMRVLNKKYWPHQTKISNWVDAEKWCYTHFKSANWRNVGNTFAFKRGEDATFFLLQWQ